MQDEERDQLISDSHNQINEKKYMKEHDEGIELLTLIRSTQKKLRILDLGDE